MYLINYFIYLYNFKFIYDVTGSTTGPTSDTGTTPFSGSLPGPVFKTMELIAIIKIIFFWFPK